MRSDLIPGDNVEINVEIKQYKMPDYNNGRKVVTMEKEVLWSDRRRLWCGLPWTFTVYSMTEDRLFIKRGLFNLREDEVRLYRIKDLGLERNLIQRMFGLGTIRVVSSDSSLGNFDLTNVKNSSDVKEQLSRLVEEERQRKKVSSREFISFEEEVQMEI